MRKKKIALMLILTVSCLLIILFLFIVLNTPFIVNDYSHRLMCENTLKAIADAIERYRDDHDGAYPPNLVEVGTYMEGKYSPSPGRAPTCPGSRSDDETSSSWDYVYRVPSNNDEVVPICWDSKPHRSKTMALPDLFHRNVLYSDGHVDTLSEQEFHRDSVVGGSVGTDPVFVGD